MVQTVCPSNLTDSFKKLFMCMCLLVWICTMYVQCLQRPEEGIGSPGSPKTAVTSGSEQTQVELGIESRFSLSKSNK